jgi:antitoxin CptB
LSYDHELRGRLSQITEPDQSHRQDQRTYGQAHGMSELDRVRWRCRRGMLELDLVLGKFIEKHYLSLSDSEIETFKEMLNYPDNELCDLILEKAPLKDECCKKLLELMKTI